MEYPTPGSRRVLRGHEPALARQSRFVRGIECHHVARGDVDPFLLLSHAQLLGLAPTLRCAASTATLVHGKIRYLCQRRRARLRDADAVLLRMAANHSGHATKHVSVG